MARPVRPAGSLLPQAAVLLTAAAVFVLRFGPGADAAFSFSGRMAAGVVLILLLGASLFTAGLRRPSALLFPLLWAASDPRLPDLASDPSPFLAAVLVLAAGAAASGDGPPRMAVGAVLATSTALLFLLPAGILLPMALAFRPDRSRRKKRLFQTAGFTGAALFILFLVFTGRGDWDPARGLLEVWELLVDDHFYAFPLLVLLGRYAAPFRSPLRGALLAPLFLLAGLLLVPTPGHSAWIGMFRLALFWGAAFGLEALRRDLLDPTWHGRAAGVAMGVALAGGLFLAES